MGLLSSLLGSAGVDVAGGGILGQLGQSLHDNSGALLGFASGGPQGMIQGKRSDMLAAAQRQEQLDRAQKIKAAQAIAQKYGLDPAMAGDPDFAERYALTKFQHDLTASTPTDTARNLIAAGYKQGSPEFQTIMRQQLKGQPDFGVIGEDASGAKQYGYIDKVNRTVTPYGGNQSVAGSNPYALSGKGGSEAQTNAALFGNRAAQAQDILNEKEDALTSTGETIGANIPFIGNRLISKDRQEAEQAKTNFVTAVLRKESGASISPTEFKQAETVYFPQPGDAPEVIDQKRQARISAVQGLMGGAGPGYTAPKGWEDPRTAGQKRQKQTPGAKVGAQIAGSAGQASPPQALPSGTYTYVPGQGLVPQQ